MIDLRRQTGRRANPEIARENKEVKSDGMH